MLATTMRVSKRLACRAVGLAWSTYARTPNAQTPTEPDAALRAILPDYARIHPVAWLRHARAHLRHDQAMAVNKEESAPIVERGRSAGEDLPFTKARRVGSCPQAEADAPNVVWTMDFQFDSTVDGKAVKIASMINEHTRRSLMNIVERSISAQRLVDELAKTFALWGGPPLVFRMDNGPEFISSALQQFCANRVGISYIPPRIPWNNGHIESFDNRLRKECLNRNHWMSLLAARVVIEDFKDDNNHRHRHSSLGYLTPAEYSGRCSYAHLPVEGCEID